MPGAIGGFLLHITDVRNDHDSSEAILYRCTYIPILLFPKVEGLNYYAPNLLRYAQRRPTYVSTSFVPPDPRTSVPTEEGGGRNSFEVEVVKGRLRRLRSIHYGGNRQTGGKPFK